MAVQIPDNSLWGMAVYRMVNGVNLTGKWNNNRVTERNAIQLEIARKDEQDQPGRFPGIYNVSWIEQTGTVITGTLEITDVDGRESEWVWRNEGREVLFQGVGMQISENEVTVIYWHGSPPLLS